MDIIEDIRSRSESSLRTIVFPRSSDQRVIKAAEYLQKNKLAKPILIQNEGAGILESLNFIDPVSDENLKKYARAFYERRKHKGITEAEAIDVIKDPLFFAAAMVAAGDADGCVAGSVSTTGDVLRAAIQTIGLKPGSNVVSSVFLMSFDDGRVFTYGDCAVVPYPNAEQLATIAMDSAQTHKKVTGHDPRVSMLSFSTKGSAQHERIDLVREALEIVKSHNLDFPIDGELQFDASIIPEIAKRKAPDSEVAGKANVFIFPNLDAGNISYKITERLAGATATGPIIQGLAKPMMDLSRGCSWEDIVNTACVCSLMGSN
ncbi:MAG: phosphate acetyltransferase [Gracilimonas sp.]|uniref:phosphate acetyltransferase n=1 Tax=Gracilimonas TaxID=649462 RepID=UPI001B026C2C|nr:phosphate acetyltransferase [Gracilimonas sp.]MBO6586378.1 phosphate acetyltransferase [Gracilimonas sp.]MBO6615035.1 phosphate acetyltransferase [Gracilimonas sp.]